MLMLFCNAPIKKRKQKNYKTFDLTYLFLLKFFNDNCFQNKFLSQFTFSTIDFKQKNNEYKVSAQNSKGVYTFKLFSLHNVSPIIKYFDQKIELQFNYSTLVVKCKNDVTKILNVYLVYDLDNWPINLVNNFILKISFF